jgi:hypothetical protein
MRQGRHEEGRSVLRRLITAADSRWKVFCTAAIRALAFRSLAIDAERRLGDRDTALEFIEKALSLEQGGDETSGLPGGLREDLERRRMRLCR